MSNTYTEKLVDVLEYLREVWETDCYSLGVFHNAYSEVIPRLENILSEMLSEPESLESDRKTFIAYMDRKEQEEN
jgi:hypothetical protein